MITAGDKIPRRDYFEPTVTSTWDAPGALGSQADRSPVKSPGIGSQGQHIDELFEEQEGNEMAGGFLLEDDEPVNPPIGHGGSHAVEDAGGFLIGDEAAEVEPKAPSSPRGKEKGGEFILEEDHNEPTRGINKPSENREAPHFKNVENITPVGAAQAQVEVPPVPEGNKHENANHTPLVSKIKEPPPKSKQGEEQNLDVEANDSDMERGSLLSHDPEDEDAEPEWLGNEVLL